MTQVSVTEQSKQVDYLYNKVDRLPINGDTIYIRTVTGQSIGEYDTVVFADYTTNTYRTQFYTVTPEDNFDVVEFNNKVVIDGITYLKETETNNAFLKRLINLEEGFERLKHDTQESLNDMGEDVAMLDERLN